MPVETEPVRTAEAGNAAPAALADAPPWGSGYTLLVVFLLMLAEGVVVYLVTAYLKAPERESMRGIQEMEFVDLGDVNATLPLEGTPTVRYFRISVACYLSAVDRDDTRLMLERLKPKLKDEIQSIMMQESYPTVRHPEAKRRVKEKVKDLLVRMLGPDRIDEVVLPMYEPQ